MAVASPSVPSVHRPVLVAEVLQLLAVKPGGVYVDGTVGAGGHAKAVAQMLGDQGVLIGIDQDEEILKIAGEALAPFKKKVRLLKGNFSQIASLVKQEGFECVDGILLDLGVSSLQLDRAERGFSFNKEGPIDMRMDPAQVESLWQKLRRTNEIELTEVLSSFGEERLAPKIAREILEKIRGGELKTTIHLADICFYAYPVRHRHQRIHPATRTFQALRIWVNQELSRLKDFLASSTALLKEDGRLCILSYHSLEDRMVKHTFRKAATTGDLFEVLTKKPIVPGDEEIAANSRSRSAKLRGLRRLPAC